jgi:hypothetical protein
MMVYWAMPYLLAAAPPIILLSALLITGCTMARTSSDPMDHAQLYSDPSSGAGETRNADQSIDA